MCQILGSRGWRLARISGSHHIYRVQPVWLQLSRDRKSLK
jgi:hypothetical protein